VRFCLPTTSFEDWQQHVAAVEHWKPGASAYELARSWEFARDFPPAVRGILDRSDDLALRGLEPLVGLPEHRVALAGGSRASQTDLFVLARAGDGELVAIAVEGKVEEPFGPLVTDWIADGSEGKRERLEQLCGLLRLDPSATGTIRYQLLHRTGSAILEAQRFGASRAMLLVHSFHPSGKHFSDFRIFSCALGVNDVQRDELRAAPAVTGPQLTLAWVTDEPAEQAIEVAELRTLGELLTQRNRIDHAIAHVLKRPAERGHIGEFIASRVFAITLEPSAANRGYDGRFASGPLAGRTVNIKLYGKREGLLDLTENSNADFYLVMCGPKGAATSSREATRDLVIESIYVFEAQQLVPQLRTRGVKIGVATSVANQYWDAAEVFPRPSNRRLILDAEQRAALAAFAPKR
jgi:hypothetical protein